MNITYYLGAGASYHACPVWKEQGEFMIKLAHHFFPGESFIDYSPKLKQHKNIDLIYKMGYFGRKALEFNTIDAYARKLFLNNSTDELKDLKACISIFFTIWQLCNKDKFISRKENKFVNIDQRYINLLSICLEKADENGGIKLNDNIRFITWNYDLQIELAYKMFSKDNIQVNQIDNSLSFIPDIKNLNKKLSVCHLNGFHGFYDEDAKRNDLFDITDKDMLLLIKMALEPLLKKYNNGEINFSSYINYAWENDIDKGQLNPIADSTYRQAAIILQQTDILVIIGYSFPPFNREIDKNLLKFGNGNIKKIIYQDPNANAEFLVGAFEFDKDKIVVEKEKKDQFVLPSLF